MSTASAARMNSLWPSRSSNEANVPPAKPDGDMDQAAAAAAAAAATTVAVADIGYEHSEQPNPPQPARPVLVRNSSAQPPPAAPPPPSQPPPPPVANAPPPPSDSLSLAQLRRIVADFPKNEAVAYDFTYEDMGPIDEEIDEWFVYQFWQWVRLSNAQRAFECRWGEDFGAETSWEDVAYEAKKNFVSDALAGLLSSNSKERLSCHGRLVYIVLGRWKHTAGNAAAAADKDGKARSASTPTQRAAMKAGAELVGDAGGAVVIWDALRAAFDPFWYVAPSLSLWRFKKSTDVESGPRMRSRCRGAPAKKHRMS